MSVGVSLSELSIKPPRRELGSECEKILRTVPEWFGREQALLNYIKDINMLDTYTAWMSDELVGFISVKYHNKWTAELYVLAVAADYHRMGIGSEIYNKIETDLVAKSFKLVQVKTIGVSLRDKHYEKTRYFYRSLGFFPLEEHPDFWGAGTPCLVMVKSI